MLRYLRYTLLYHDRLWAISLLVTCLLLVPVYIYGLGALPTQVLAKVFLTAILIGLWHRRPRNNAVFFLNMNVEVRNLLVLYLLLDTLCFLLAAWLLLALR